MTTPEDEFGIDWDFEAERCSKTVLHGYTDCSFFNYFKEFITPDMEILELGCNIANWYPTWRSLEPTIKYTGLDFSKRGLEIAKERYPNITLIYGNIKNIDFENIDFENMKFNFVNRFDIVFTHTFFQHVSLETKKIIVPKVWKALKPGGLLIIQENTATVSDATWNTIDGWVIFFEKYGFKNIKLHDIGGGGTGMIYRKIG